MRSDAVVKKRKTGVLGMHLNLNIHVIIILRNVERPYDILLRRF